MDPDSDWLVLTTRPGRPAAAHAAPACAFARRTIRPPDLPVSQPSQSACTTRTSSQASLQVRAVGSCHARPKMTSRFRRLPAMTRGQAPRPGVVEDRSSCADHHHRIWSMKTVSSICNFPLKISGEISPELRGIFPGIAGKFPLNSGEISRESDAFAGRSNQSLGSWKLRIKKTFIE